jgi:hypothetical protein
LKGYIDPLHNLYLSKENNNKLNSNEKGSGGQWVTEEKTGRFDDIHTAPQVAPQKSDLAEFCTALNRKNSYPPESLPESTLRPLPKGSGHFPKNISRNSNLVGEVKDCVDISQWWCDVANRRRGGGPGYHGVKTSRMEVKWLHHWRNVEANEWRAAGWCDSRRRSCNNWISI